MCKLSNNLFHYRLDIQLFYRHPVHLSHITTDVTRKNAWRRELISRYYQYNAASFLYKPWRPKGFIQFENIGKCLS